MISSPRDGLLEHAYGRLPIINTGNFSGSRAADLEELVYNSIVLKTILINKIFRLSSKRYFLANIKYYTTSFILIPYDDIKYYLKK